MLRATVTNKKTRTARKAYSWAAGVPRVGPQAETWTRSCHWADITGQPSVEQA